MAADTPKTAASASTFPQLLTWRAGSTPDGVALRRRVRGVWRELTWRALDETVTDLGYALLASGVQRGEAVAFFGGPCLEGLLFTIAAQGIGAVPCGLSPWYSGEEATASIQELGAAFLLAGGQEFVDVLMERGELGGLRTAAVADESGMFGDEYNDVLRWATLLERGRARRAQRPDEWRQLVERGSVSDPCGIYLSPSDGSIRAVALTYANILAGWFQGLDGRDGRPRTPSEKDRLFHDIPIGLVHGAVFGIFLTLVHGAVSHVPDNHDSFAQARMEASPTYAVASPGVWQERATHANEQLERSSPVHRAMFRLAMATRGPMLAHDGSLRRSPWRRALAAVGYAAVVRPMRDQWGLLRIREAFVAGGELPDPTARQWRLWGIDIRQCYGLPETAGLMAMGLSGGRAGRTPLPGVEVTVSADQELLVKGPNVAGHRWRAGLIPNDRLDAAKWLHTGDADQIDARGVNAGRRDEDLLVLADGTAVSSSAVVDALRQSPYVRDAIAFGDGRPYLGALVDLDSEQVAAWASKAGHGELDWTRLADHQEVGRMVRDELEKVNRGLVEHGHQPVRRIALLPIEPRPQEPPEVTTLQSARRRILTDRYRREIDGLYEDPSSEVYWLGVEGVTRDDSKSVAKAREEER